MKCIHCGSEWTVGAESAMKVKNCPFCGKPLQSEAKAETKPETLEGILQMIHDQFGLEPFRNGKTLIGLHQDLAPDRQKDRRLIAHFVACGGHPFLEAALKKPKSEQAAALVRLVRRMYEDWLIREDASRRICAIWWQILGGDPEHLKAIEQPVCEAPAQKGTKGTSHSRTAKTAGPVCRSADYRIEGNVLKEYTGTDTDIQLPAGITAIGRSAFAHCEKLRSVVIPDSVTTVDMQAFLGCSGLTKISLPKDLKAVGYAAFRDCAELETVSLPEGLRHIDDYAFKNCAKLHNIILPQSMETIGYEAFRGCAALESITLPGKLKNVAGRVFQGCTGLRAVNIAEGVQSLGNYAFASCTALDIIRIPGSISAVSGDMFSECSALCRAQLDEGVKRIGDDTFKDCRSLKTVVIPDSVAEIHPDAFRGCSGITVQASQSWKKAHPDLLAKIPQ